MTQDETIYHMPNGNTFKIGSKLSCPDGTRYTVVGSLGVDTGDPENGDTLVIMEPVVPVPDEPETPHGDILSSMESWSVDDV